MPTFPARAADRLGVDPSAVRDLIRGPFRDDYWGGRVPESAFWHALGVPVPDAPDRMAILNLRPRIDPARVAAWREVADIWIISNHRHEWLLPVLAQTGLADVVDHVVISSVGGHVKPDPAAWAVLLADGTAAPTDTIHNATLVTIYRSFGDVRPVAEVIGMLGAAQHRAGAGCPS